MNIRKILVKSILITFGLFPLTMSSADIYELARWEWVIVSVLNNNMILSDEKLSSNIVIYKTKERYNDPKIYTTCNHEQKLVSSYEKKNEFIYIIYFKISWNKCIDKRIFIKNGVQIYKNTWFDLKINTYSDLFTYFTDFDNNFLQDKLDKDNILSYKLDTEIFDIKWKDDIKSKLKYLDLIYKNSYNEFEITFLNNLINSRKNLSYISPVAGKLIPTKKNIVPNAWRPYRAKYTDWVHHWYDIFASRYTPTQALSDGVIVRIIDNFTWNDFDKIRWKNLSNEDKLFNLDIYRGNQVWLKTADWNITFYSHLESVNNDLKEWDYVYKWSYIWAIWRSGVPDKEYRDFHLHFEIQINPYNKTNNSFDEIMAWKFFGQNKKYNEIILSQTKLFWSYNIAYK